MVDRLITLRLVLAAAGGACFAGGFAARAPWLTGVGLAGLLCAELTGLLTLARPLSPGRSALNGLAGFLPALAVALALPYALLAMAGLVAAQLMAGGIRSVLASRGAGVATGGLALGIAAFATNLLLMAAAGARMGWYEPAPVTTDGLVTVAVALAMLSWLRAMLDAVLDMRRR